MRSLILLVVAALTLMPVAGAQTPPGLPVGATPTYTVTITNPPAELTGLTANGTAQAPFSVVLELGNVVCTAPVTIPVTVTAAVANAPPNLAVTVEPSVLNFTIGEGPHAPTPAGGTADAMIVGTVTGNITANATVAITLTATAPAPAGAPQGCQGAGSIPAATSAPVQVNATMVETPQPPVEEPPAEDTPFVGVLAVLGVAAAVALARRRKA